MQVPRAHPAPEQEHHSADDSDIPAWQAAYVTCPACHRPVRRERLARHMEILHADVEPADDVPPEGEAVRTGLRGLLARLFGRRAEVEAE